MNFDILQKSTPEECMRAFLEKETRYDNRKLYQSRKFNYKYGVLNLSSFTKGGIAKIKPILSFGKIQKN